MGTELTHDQAEVLRIADSTAHPLHPHCYSATYELAMDGRRLAGLIEHWCVGYGLTEAGREALAAYDAEFVTVRRDDVRDATGSFEKSIVLAEWDGPTWEEPREALARLRAALEAA